MHVYIHMIAYRNRNHTFFIYRAIDHLAAPIGYACSKTKERIFPVCKISLVSFQRPDYQIGGISRPSVILNHNRKPLAGCVGAYQPAALFRKSSDFRKMRECRGRQALCAKSRAASVWSVSRGETFGPGAGRQRLLRCPEGETLGPVK